MQRRIGTAVSAAPDGCDDPLGDGSGPSETTMSTLLPFATWSPARGFCWMMLPLGAVWDQAEIT
jgi:hypothetical protein